MSGAIGLGMVGVGEWARVLAAVIDRNSDAELVSCFSRTETARRQFASDFGCSPAGSLDELLDDDRVDGVIVATSHNSHVQIVQQAAAAGKAVFVEKPLATRPAEARTAVQAAEAAGVPLQVGHQRRRSAAIRRIKSLLEAGTLGDIELIEANQSLPSGDTMPPTAWRWDPSQSPLGSMTGLGVHKLDTLSFLAGPIDSVFAFTRAGRDVPVDEATALSLRFEGGALGTLVTSMFVPTVSEVRVHGRDASAFASKDGTRLHLLKRGSVESELVTLEETDPVRDEIDEFVKVVRGEMQPETDGRAGLAVVAALQAAVDSVASGRAMAVAPYLTDGRAHSDRRED